MEFRGDRKDMKKHFGLKRRLVIAVIAALLLCGCKGEGSSKREELRDLAEALLAGDGESEEKEQETEGQETQEQTSQAQEGEADASQAGGNLALGNGEETAVQSEYLISDSNIRYLTWDDIKEMSADELRFARNEVYARYGRKFQSQDLQDYFNSKAWYNGTIEANDFNEGILNEYEKANIQFLMDAESAAGLPGLAEAPSKEMIDRYGYEQGYSVLSFDLVPGTAADRGEYYEVDAVYKQGIEAPGNLGYGDQVTLVFDELTGEKRTLVYREGGLYSVGEAYEEQFYYSPSADGSPVVLYQYSDDRVEKPIYRGELYIRKDATSEVAIMNEKHSVTREELANGGWYNGVYFDSKGYVVRLVFYGD